MSNIKHEYYRALINRLWISPKSAKVVVMNRDTKLVSSADQAGGSTLCSSFNIKTIVGFPISTGSPTADRQQRGLIKSID